MKKITLVFVLTIFSIPSFAQDNTAPNAAIASPPMVAPAPQPSQPTLPSLSDISACNPPSNLIGRPKSTADGIHANGPVRIMKLGDPATMDYSPQRLNIIYDDKGIIIGVKCG